jgi:hypothetical protein
VHRSSTQRAQRTQVVKDKGFFQWMRHQRLYYNAVLSDSSATALDRILASGDPQLQANALAVCRILYTVTQPDRWALRKHSMSAVDVWLGRTPACRTARAE